MDNLFPNRSPKLYREADIGFMSVSGWILGPYDHGGQMDPLELHRVTVMTDRE